MSGILFIDQFCLPLLRHDVRWRGIGTAVFLGRDRCRELIRHKFGPDKVPVVGAKIAAGDFAIGGALNSWAALNRNWSLFRSPLTQKRIRNAKNNSKFLGASIRFREVFIECHEPIINESLMPVNTVSLIHI